MGITLLILNNVLMRQIYLTYYDILYLLKLNIGGSSMLELLRKNESSGEFRRANELIPNAFELIDSMICNRDSRLGIKTGFDNLDSIMQVIRKKELMVLASRSGVGKSTFILNIAYNLAMNNLSVLYYSLELSGKQLVSSILCSAGGVTDEIIASGNIDDGKMSGLFNVAWTISNKRLFLDYSSYLTTDVLADKCRKIKHAESLDVVIIDYLQLMGNDKISFQSRKEEIDSMLKELKELAKDLDISIVVLSQLYQSADSKEKPDMQDFGESSGVEKYANTILLLSR